MLKVYKKVISPLVHAFAGAGYGCRFSPTCREYCEGAVKEHGVFRGIFLGFKRVLKCHPFHRGGWDPIPNKKPS